MTGRRRDVLNARVDWPVSARRENVSNPVHAAAVIDEERLARERAAARGKRLSRITLAYNSAEGVAAIVAGLLAGSVALVGFGFDSVIEVASSLAALFRLHRDA